MAEQRVKVILFKESGRYYTEEEWRVPATVPDKSPTRGEYTRAALGPWDMQYSPDWRRVGGAVLVDSQEPWGYPHLFPAGQLTKPEKAVLDKWYRGERVSLNGAHPDTRE